MKRIKHKLKKGMALVLSLAMVAGLVPEMPGGANIVQAATGSGTGSTPSVSAYAPKTQLMDDTFAPDSNGNANNIGKLVFGKNSSGNAQEWYILGKDNSVSGDNTIIFAASPIATNQVFNSNTSDKTFESSFGVYENNPSEVYSNHYGASELRAALQNMADGSNTTYFTTFEQGLMNATTVTTVDTKNWADYTTTDKLYALVADDIGNNPIKAGTNGQIVLAKNSYWETGEEFWLRSPTKPSSSGSGMGNNSAMYAEESIINTSITLKRAVQPASNLDLSSVLFASGAKTASSGTVSGTITDGTAMTLRLDGKRQSALTNAGLKYNHEKITYTASSDITLMVQGRGSVGGEEKDWYYSVTGGTDAEEISASDVALSLDYTPNLNDCKIWVELTDTNGLTYAVMGEDSKGSVTAFATPDELMSAFNPDSNGNATTIGKLVFGKNSSGNAQEWYILGKDTGVEGDNTIIFATSPIADSQIFASSTSNKTFDSSFGVYANNPTEVYPNHYGASDLRVALQRMLEDESGSAVETYFTTAEQSLMNDTTVTTNDIKNNVTYTATDKLYALQGDYYNQYLWAGSSASTVLAMNSYWKTGDSFWLRSAYESDSSCALLAYTFNVQLFFVNYEYAVRPASNLNLSSVLFASGAKAASDAVSAGTISSDTAMTLRLDGSNTEIGTAYYDMSKGVIVADRAAAAAGTVSLIVQGNDGTIDWYYSVPVGERTVVTTENIKAAITSLSTDPDLADCNIWLETTSDNVAYAKMAETINIETVNSVTVTGIQSPVGGEEFVSNASCTDTGISTTTPTITYTTAGEAEVTGKADWNTTYKATVTLTTKKEVDTIYVFDSSVSVTIDGETQTNVTPNADGTLTVTREFTTARRKITGVTAPTVPETFKTYYGYEGNAETPINESNTELGKTATVTFEGTVEPITADMDVTWTIENAAGYDKTPGAVNTFRWTIPESALTNYNATDCANYDSNTKTITGTVTITNKAATPVIITGTDSSIAYTGTTIDVSKYFNIDPNAGTKTYSLITGEEGGTGEGSLDGSSLTVTKTGTFKIKVETAANGIYAAGDATITLTVANGTIDYTATDYSGTYDGQAHSISVNVKSPEGTTVTYSTDGVTYNSDNPSFKNVGNYTVYYQITKDNYTTIIGNKTVTISKKEITASVQADNKVYDGNVTATVTATAATGIAGETLTISGLTGSFADKNAGNDKTVTVDASSVNVTGGENGTSASNYSITYAPTTKASITSLTAHLSWGNSQFTYNGNEQVPTATVSNLLSGDACTVTVTGGQTDANEAGGTYTAEASIDNSNYSIKEEHKTTEFTISNASQSAPSLTGVNETIKGKEDGKITGLTTEMEYRIVTQPEGEANESTNSNPFTKVTDAYMTFAPGTYEVRYAEKKNYNASAMTSVTISEGRMLQVTIPQAENQIGYSLSVSDEALAWQGNTTLTFALKTGYSKRDDFAVKAVYTSENTEGNVAITDNSDGTYTISNVTGDVTVTVEGVADITAPTAEIKIGTNSWNQFRDNIIFNKFFKNTKTVTITASDSVTENPTIQYLLSDNELTIEQLKSENVTWTAYTGAFGINVNSKKIVYAKATDEAGNTIIVNSDGIVVYVDSVADTTAVTYIKNVTGDVNAQVTLNGNRVAGIKNGSDTLTNGTDYTVDANGNITFKGEYLKTLSVGNYTLTVSYHPMGVSYGEGNENEAPNTTELTLTVKNPKLISITQPTAITGVQNGADKTAAALGLPETVTISTEDTGVTTAGVNWDLTNLASGTYDPSVLTEQSFTVKGTVTLPVGVDNPDNVSLNVTVSVTVIAVDIVGAPESNVQAGTYTENQSVTLTTSTEGATIYYTTDGSDPALSGGEPSGTTQQYTAPIAVTGTEGQSITTTIKAIAVKDRIQNSGVATFSYTIGIPDTTAPTAEIKIGTNSWNQFWNRVTFGWFFKNTKAVTITASDGVTASPTIKYYLSDNGLTETEVQSDSISWTDYSGEFSINANSKKIVYAKATDEAGNSIIVNSDGIVVYVDSVAETTAATYIKYVTGDVDARVALNGNTVAGIKNGSDVLTNGTDYTVDANGNITFKATYLETLSVGNYTLTVSYHPMGESYGEGNENEAPNTTELSLTVRNPKLNEIVTAEEKKENSMKLDKESKAEWKDNKFTVAWGIVEEAEGYDIFAVQCGKKMTSKSLVKTVKGQKSSSQLAKIAGKKLSGSKTYKVKIKAFKMINGKKVYIGTSQDYHVAGKNSKIFTNAKKVKVSKKSLAIKKGKTSQIKATIVKQSPKKKLLDKSHGPALRYYSTDTNVATVTSKGKIKAKGKGTCYIYVTALNGVNARVKVTVK